MAFRLRRCALVALAAVLGGCATEAAKAPASSESNQPASPPTPARVRATVPPPPTDVIPSGRSVYYDYDHSDIRPEAQRLIEANAKYLRDHPGLKTRVEGNADERGSAEYNLALGQRRAEGVAKALRLLGVSDDRMEAVSFGKEKPRNTGHDEASWAENRRSDIVY